jgi:hypothetical protein
MTGKVTSFDVARWSDVCRFAVSPAFSGVSASKVNKSKVSSAVDALGCWPNLLARGLITGRSTISDSKFFLSGVVDATANFFDHYRLVAERIAKFACIVAADYAITGFVRVFGTSTGFRAVDHDVAFAKLDYLIEGATLESS